MDTYPEEIMNILRQENEYPQARKVLAKKKIAVTIGESTLCFFFYDECFNT